MWHQGDSINDDNNTLTENVPNPGLIAPGLEEVLNSIGLVFPRRAANFLNSFVSFKQYSKEKVIKTSCLDLFLVLFHFKYPNGVMISQTNKVFDPSTDISEFVQ